MCRRGFLLFVNQVKDGDFKSRDQGYCFFFVSIKYSGPSVLKNQTASSTSILPRLQRQVLNGTFWKGGEEEKRRHQGTPCE